MLSGKNAVITGCSRGIGKAVVENFSAHGANIFAHARTKTKEFEEFCIELAKRNRVKIIPIFFDITKEDEIKAGIREILNYEKKIDILVNNVGIVGQVSLFQMTSIQKMRNEFEVNFFGSMLVTQLISKIMIRKKSGSIVNISSCAGLDGNTGMLEYVSSKAAMIGATKRLAIELGAYNIRVNSVAPGLTDTQMGAVMREDLLEDVFRKLVIKRKARPEEIADAVLFFASDMSTFITGQTLRVDGGLLN